MTVIDLLYPKKGKTITMESQSTCSEVRFCQVWAFNKRRLFRSEVFKKYGLSTIFLIFSDTGIVFSGKFQMGHIFLDIFLRHFLVFYMIFKKFVQKI